MEKKTRVRTHLRRRAKGGHRPPRNYGDLVEVNYRIQQISPSRTLAKIAEYDRTMRELGAEPRDTRALHSYVQAIALHIAGNIEWKGSLYEEALRDERLDMTDKHLLEEAVKEMQDNEKALREAHKSLEELEQEMSR